MQPLGRKLKSMKKLKRTEKKDEMMICTIIYSGQEINTSSTAENEDPSGDVTVF